MPLPRDWGGIPSMDDIATWDVNRRGEYEGIRQSLYDILTYAQAGQTQLNFFQVPVGQAAKTLDDTNMDLAGQLPSPKNFLAQSIEIYLLVDLDVVTVDNAADTDITPPEFANDIYDVLESGHLNFAIGSKSYLTEAPLMRFPPKTRVQTEHAFGGTMKQAAAADEIAMVFSDYATGVGRPYTLAPPIRLIPTQNFKVELNWAAAVAVSKAFRVGVVLDGILYRESQ